jgi:hypothetical protein
MDDTNPPSPPAVTTAVADSPAPAPAPASRGSSFLSAFRLRLDPNTDVVALTALFLSIGGLIYQGFLAVKKPDILQFPPEQILFYPEQSNGVDYVQVGAQSTYVNKGKGDRNAVLRMERVLFDLGGKTYELKWQNFVSYSNKGTTLDAVDPKPALPVVLKSGEGASHETHFAPRSLHVKETTDEARYRNFLPWDKFISEIEKVKELDLRIVGEFYGLKDKQMQVYVEVTPGIVHSLKTYRWAAPSAWPRESTPAKQSSSATATPARDSPGPFFSPQAPTTAPTATAASNP